MIGRERALALLEDALRRSSADQTEAVLLAEETAFTRFAGSTIHQPVAEENATLHVRAAVGKRIGRASTNRLDAEQIAATVELAARVARLQPETPEFEELPAGGAPLVAPLFSAATAAADAEQRSRAVAVVFEQAAQVGATAAGFFSTSVQELAVANSRGLRAYAPSTVAYLRTVFTTAEGSGYADALARDVRDLDPLALGAEAAARATRNRAPVALPPGEYVTIFEPYAVADLLRFWGVYAFGAKPFEEGRSVLSGRLGQPVTGPLVTIVDDVAHPLTVGFPFDVEGVPRCQVVLIERGLARGVVHDSLSAARAGTASTGHAARPLPWESGPVPAHLVMAGGSSSVAEMVRQTTRGLLVTRLHYTHAPDPKRLVATGMTRDGTFLIERGEIVTAVKDLRFTQALPEAFAAIDLLAARLKLQRDWWATFDSVVPAFRTRRFRFTGATAD